MEAPLKIIINKLKEAHFITKGKSQPKFIWLGQNHDQIIHLYNSIVRGFLNYYSFAHNYNKLVSTLIHILKGSCGKIIS
jgi:hypothetical protein